MKFTGHADYKSMKPYIDIAEKAKTDAMDAMEKALSEYAILFIISGIINILTHEYSAKVAFFEQFWRNIRPFTIGKYIQNKHFLPPETSAPREGFLYHLPKPTN